jgi:hypothetical protein
MTHRLIGKRNQFFDCPNMIRQSRFHRRRHAKGLVYPAEVVICEVKRNRRFQVRQLLAVAECQSRKSFDRLPKRQVLPLHKRRADVAHVRATVAYFYYRLNHRSRRVVSSGIVLAVVAKQLYHLSEVRLSRENILNSFAIKVESIGRKLETVRFRDSITESGQELVSSFAATFAYRVGRNQFCIGVNRDENPSVSEFLRIFRFHVALVLASVGPKLVPLNPFATKIPHLRIHQSYAAFPSENQEPENRIAVELGDSLSAANASAFDQELNRQQCFIFGHGHCAEQSGVFFGVGLATLSTAEALESVAMLPKLAASDIALRAIHGLNIQQALAVCQEETEGQYRWLHDENATSPQTSGVQ